MAVIVSLILACAVGAAAWRSEDTLPATSSFAEYAGKFCFDYTPPADGASGETEAADVAGVLELRVWGEVQSPCVEVPCVDHELYFMVFDDESKHWGRVRGRLEDASCEEHLVAASWAVRLSHELAAAPFEFTRDLKIAEHLRPRFWHFAFVNCGRGVARPLSYSLHARNPNQGLQAEFGMNEHGSMPTSVCFGLLFLAAFAAARASRGGEGRSRPLLRLLEGSALCSVAGCWCLALSHAAFAQDGRELLLVRVLGTLCACAAKAALVLLQFMVAKGLALVYGEEERGVRAGIAAALAGIFLLSAGSEIYGEFFRDQSASLYLYESWPGVLILALNVCLLGAALQSTWDSYRKESSTKVRAFYQLASVANGVYFASLPTVCLLASLLSPWVRSKYVERVELTARLAASVLFLLCLWPSRLDGLVGARPSKGPAPLDFEESADEEEGRALGDPEQDHQGERGTPFL